MTSEILGLRTPVRMAAAALIGYAVLAIVLTWPLVLHLQTELPGDPSGDTGVYVWNLWVFRHEAIDHRHLPFSTEHIFAFSGRTNLSLHNYTAVAGILAIPLIGAVGVVGAFNLVLLAGLTLSAAATWLLARQWGLTPLAAWVAGGLFVAMPLISAREMAHLSLVLTGALPLFLWALQRTLEHPTVRRGAGIGAIVALASYSDAYFGVYCVLMGLFLIAWRFLDVRSRTVRVSARVMMTVDLLMAASALALVAGLVSGLDELAIGPVLIRGIDKPYAPAVALMVLAGVRLLLTRRFSFRIAPGVQPGIPDLLPAGAVAVATTVLLQVPVLMGIAERFASGRLPATAIPWRSSPRGVDLLAYIVPNPVHAVVGQWTNRWLLPPVEDAFPELIASCSIVAVAAVLIAGYRGWLPRFWVWFTLCFGLLSLGPFVHVAGVNTFLLGPWALLRYVPLIGLARSPSRFAIVAALGLSMLFGFAIQQWRARQGGRWSPFIAAMLALVAIEVVPGPRMLFSAEVPEIYNFVASNGNEEGRLLELPTGIRDGTSSVGDFSALSSYFQTRHGRPLIGGYLSRVSEWRRREGRGSPVLRALFALSEHGGRLTPDVAADAKAHARRFLARTCVRYVIVDNHRASAELREFAVETLGLIPMHSDDRYELLVPAAAPPCTR